MSARELVGAFGLLMACGCAVLQSAERDPAAAVAQARKDADRAETVVGALCDKYKLGVAKHVVKSSKVAEDICAANAALAD